MARLVTHPLDTAKARLQAPPPPTSSSVGAGTTAAATAVSKTHYRGPLDVLQRTVRTEGIRGLYRGLGTVLVGGTPGTVVYLCSYEMAKDALSEVSASSSSKNNNNNNNVAVHFASGMLAEAIACIIYVPVDVIKERLQIQHGVSSSSTTHTPHNQQQPHYYKNSWHAIQTIARSEGILTLYKGYGATLLSFGSYSGLFFLFYERLLEYTRDYLELGQPSSGGVSNNVPFHWTVLCSCTAGAMASWLTSPLDMAKLRLQVQRRQAGGTATATTVAYRGMIDCLQHSYRHEGGFRGLFRGAGARVLHFAPATTVTMTAYETCRSFFAGLLYN
jgi:hypothetical protein